MWHRWFASHSVHAFSLSFFLPCTCKNATILPKIWNNQASSPMDHLLNHCCPNALNFLNISSPLKNITQGPGESHYFKLKKLENDRLDSSFKRFNCSHKYKVSFTLSISVRSLIDSWSILSSEVPDSRRVYFKIGLAMRFRHPTRIKSSTPRESKPCRQTQQRNVINWKEVKPQTMKWNEQSTMCRASLNSLVSENQNTMLLFGSCWSYAVRNMRMQ